MKTYLQCGYEDKCKNKDCLNCKRQYKKYNLNLSIAELVAIEGFAVCDLKQMLRLKQKELELIQDIMKKVMKKVFNEESKVPKETKVTDFHRKSQGSINSNSQKLNLEKEKSL